MYADERERILRSVKESVDEAGQKPEDSAYYFVIGLAVAIFIGLIIIVANIKFKTNQLAVYGQKIQNEVTNQLKTPANKDLQVDDLSNQIASLQLALSTRVDFASLFRDLINNQYKKSKWKSISISSEKLAIDMEADNFDDVSKSLKTLQNIKSVQAANLSDVRVDSSTEKVSFTVELEIDFNAYKVSKANERK